VPAVGAQVVRLRVRVPAAFWPAAHAGAAVWHRGGAQRGRVRGHGRCGPGSSPGAGEQQEVQVKDDVFTCSRSILQRIVTCKGALLQLAGFLGLLRRLLDARFIALCL
jgi:hypothetical protein